MDVEMYLLDGNNIMGQRIDGASDCHRNGPLILAAATRQPCGRRCDVPKQKPDEA
jgi:hypothetical protein